MTFKNRGHYCNYCRKILVNKIIGKNFHTININQVIWYGWDNPSYQEEIVDQLKALVSDCTNKEYNNQLRALLHKYGFENKPKSDYERKKNYRLHNK